LLAHVLERKIGLVAHLIAHDPADADPARLGTGFEGVQRPNNKSCWYEFDTTLGEHGYPPGHPRRNADVTERSRLIIDPGPRTVTGLLASFSDGQDRRGSATGGKATFG
jgi:hypothetical protein